MFKCCLDKVITRFIQDRLRLSKDENELLRFYEKMVHLDDTEMIIMCKHQMGNYIIQIILTNAPHTEPGKVLIIRIM